MHIKAVAGLAQALLDQLQRMRLRTSDNTGGAALWTGVERDCKCLVNAGKCLVNVRQYRKYSKAYWKPGGYHDESFQ